jgi:hypothetical protein
MFSSPFEQTVDVRRGGSVSASVIDAAAFAPTAACSDHRVVGQANLTSVDDFILYAVATTPPQFHSPQQ